ncbi:putative monocarboxylate permease [Seiridium cardinale]|uniref:Monocarboxylate permease n=1 Tax=Seiridium cardinale TaxID=138064 RepID=A0ABR2X908_9PEZI
MALLLDGIGGSLMYTTSTNLPVKWFDKRLGTANGLVKLGGCIGATVMEVVVQLMIDTVGLAWTFRAIALASLASGIPAARLIKETTIAASSIDMSLFRNWTFFLLFMAGFVGIFALGMVITGWSVGDLLGNPIAGFLIVAAYADRSNSIVPYRAAIFYAGGTAVISMVLVLAARLRMDTKVIKKL